MARLLGLDVGEHRAPLGASAESRTNCSHAGRGSGHSPRFGDNAFWKDIPGAMAPGRNESKTGVFVSLQGGGLGTESLLVASTTGAPKAAQFRALPARDRWDASSLLAMTGSPWDWLEAKALRAGQIFTERAPDPFDLPQRAVPRARATRPVYLRRDVELAR